MNLIPANIDFFKFSREVGLNVKVCISPLAERIEAEFPCIGPALFDSLPILFFSLRFCFSKFLIPFPSLRLIVLLSGTVNVVKSIH